MNLDALNLAEKQIFLRVEQNTGSVEEKDLQLQKSGVYSGYRKIYEAYVELIESKTEQIEALKRSTFLMWFEQSEPSCFTGISGLSEKASQKVLQSLEHRIESDTLDFELKWMLPYYISITEWMFAEHTNLPNIQKFLIEVDYELKVELKLSDFINRGQMGEYWLSIISNAAKRIDRNKT